MGALQTVLRVVVLPLVVIGVGIGVNQALVKSKPEPKKEEQPQLGTLVRVMTVQQRSEAMVVQAQGTVTPARQIVMQPEVQGQVTWKSPLLVPGGRFKQGDILLRIDAREYALQEKQRSVSVDQARQALAIEQARREIAREEWQIVGEGDNATELGRSVALREPHLKQAEASLVNAENAADLARLSLGRTTLRAPFNGFVKNAAVDVGQLVGPQSQLATLIGSDRFWIQTSVPVNRLPRIRVPGFNAAKGEGSTATIWQDLGGARIDKQGTLVQLLGDLDPVGRMARVLVEIDDPLGLKAEADAKRAKRGAQAEAPEVPETDGASKMPLLVGAYVHVEIDAQQMVNVAEVPRSAVHGGDQVYIAKADDTLEMREVEIVWRRKETVLIGSGLKSGDRLVVSRIATPIAGMKLRVSSAQEKSASAPESASPEAAKGEL